MYRVPGILDTPPSGSHAEESRLSLFTIHRYTLSSKSFVVSCGQISTVGSGVGVGLEFAELISALAKPLSAPPNMTEELLSILAETIVYNTRQSAAIVTSQRVFLFMVLTFLSSDCKSIC